MYDIGNDDYIIPNTHPCRNVEEIKATKNHIFIHFKRNLKIQNPFLLASYFSYNATVYDFPVYFPPDSEVSASFIDKKTLELVLPFPVIYDYFGEIQCRDTPNNAYDETIYYRRKLNISLESFQEDVFTSQLKCFGSSKEDLVCKATNISFSNGIISIISPAKFVLPRNFINMGSRKLSFKKRFHVVDSHTPVINKRVLSNAADFLMKDTQVFLYSEGRNEEQKKVFNRIIDVYIPAYLTLKKYQDNGSKPVFLDLNSNFEFDQMLNAIVNDSRHVQIVSETVIIENAVIGLEKIDKKNRSYSFEDQFTGETFDFNEFMIRKFYKEAKVNKKAITILNPEGDFHVGELENASSFFKERCPTCDVQYYIYDYTYPMSVMNRITETNVLIARTQFGSELSLFMGKGTLLIDIASADMECDKRSQKYAQIAGVDYYKLRSSIYYEANECTNNACKTLDCHTQSLNDFISVSNETLAEAWSVAMKYI